MKETRKILALEKALSKLDKLCSSIDFVRIRIASPERIKSWSMRIFDENLVFNYNNKNSLIGEVFNGETINHRTLKPIRGGLFCQRIFGPIKDGYCECSQNFGIITHKVCINCGVELTESRTRRYRMGYIDLNTPISHVWYFKGRPSYLTDIISCFETKTDINLVNDEEIRTLNGSQLFLFKEIKKKVIDSLNYSQIKKIIYSEELDLSIEDSNHPLHNIKICLDNTKDYKGNTKLFSFDKKFNEQLKRKNAFEIINSKLKSNNHFSKGKLSTGNEILKAALESLDICFEINRARNEILNQNKINKISLDLVPFSSKLILFQNKKILNRIRILESFYAANIKLSWIILTILPVLPPTLRPIVQLEEGQLIPSNLNELYQYIIWGIKLNNSEDNISTIKANSIRILQQYVDSLIDNNQSSNKKVRNDNSLQSLTERLQGKEGRFRNTILGKRVDYSGRSVITVGPYLRLNECGLPYEIAIELFKPFLINELLKLFSKTYTKDLKLINYILEKKKPYIWVLIKKIASKYCILLNRAPTLHRFGIQAFNPVIVLGQAIQLHPLVTSGFNADFDGDQMAIHLPLQSSSQLEASLIMKPSSNIFSQANGNNILKPAQDIVIGIYYLTLMIKKNYSISQKSFSSEHDALSSYMTKKLSLHDTILIRYSLIDTVFKISFNKLKFLNNKEILANLNNIEIYKIFYSKKNYYLITNIGILIARKKLNFYYNITEFFLETTPGRIIFNLNLRKSIEIK